MSKPLDARLSRFCLVEGRVDMSVDGEVLCEVLDCALSSSKTVLIQTGSEIYCLLLLLPSNEAVDSLRSTDFNS